MAAALWVGLLSSSTLYRHSHGQPELCLIDSTSIKLTIKTDYCHGNARTIEWKGGVTPDTEDDYLWSALVPACD